MSNTILVIGSSGTGKSTSTENLPAEKTFYINCIGKNLPFKGWKSKYTKAEGGKGNYLVTDNTAKIISALEFINNERPDIEYVVIDDFQYTMANEYMRRAHETGFAKFTEINQKCWQFADKVNSLRDNLNIAILTHAEETTDSSGIRTLKAKTIGKMMDNVITLEGYYTTVFYTNVDHTGDTAEYQFITNDFHTAKSSRGMYDREMPNDLKLAFEKMDEYNLG